MVDLSSLPIIKQIISMFSYLHKYFDLNAKEKRLKKWEDELSNLKKISEENSNNYKSMVDFNIIDPNIQAGDNEPSPHLQFTYYISNRSIFDLKIKKIRIKLYLNNYGELGVVNGSDIFDLPHQQKHHDQYELQLHSNTIEILKKLKKEDSRNSIEIEFRDIKLDFEGDKVFSTSPHSFRFEMPMKKINVTI
ncbi:MAG: hypothetical protein C3F06_11270 [Candidatus Methanoperedenaceae archaeon]|nr:MAG: hypothetical protein C3F06_11270 [Candidatus Methanoperedenaceae archaeon]